MSEKRATARAGRMRRLARAGDRGDADAMAAVWDAWTHHPGDELWELLTRWRYPPDRPYSVLSAAASSLPRASRRAIGESCVRHGLRAGDEFWRIELYALTGLTAQLRAADPDGTRLAAVYQAADERRRGSLRLALAEAGEIDLVRTMGAGAADPRGWDGLARDEQFFLLSALTGQRDWPALWRLAQQLPVPAAAHCVLRMGGSWAPDDERGRALFTALARAVRLHRTVPGWAEAVRWSGALPAGHRQALEALSARPLPALRPADLETASWLLRSPDLGAARALVQALKDCLDVRFGTEVALGPATAGLAPDDIALPDTGREPPC
jgi:hypothetical protein